jgi:ElaB/YqjD/DUF883 family membrane-anchored ribosome-binding protein
MGEDPVTIRKDIERTREEMGETLGAIGYKTDVQARAKDAVHDKVDTVKDKMGFARDKVSGATPDAEQARQVVRRGAGMAQENPLGLAIGAVAVGFVAGLLVPETKVEHEKLGPAADQLKDQVRETASEAVEHGKQVAQEVAQSAKETAQEHGQQVADSARS